MIPIYNSEIFLRESIESVLSQTYSNIEIICVNDGSTDSSLDILNHFSDKIIIISQKNQGLASALNTGIEAISGRWFKWFSPDDEVYPSSIEQLVNTAKDLDDNTIIYSNWDISDETGKKLRSFTESNYNDLSTFDFNVRLLDGQQINVNTALIPSLLFARGLRMNTLIDPVLVDYDFFLRAGLFYQTKFHLVEKQLIKSRIHTNQLSHKDILKNLKNLESLKNEFLSNLDENLQSQYLKNFKTYRKNRPISKKIIEVGLRLLSALFPNNIVNNLLLFYLRTIRKSR